MAAAVLAAAVLEWHGPSSRWEANRLVTENLQNDRPAIQTVETAPLRVRGDPYDLDWRSSSEISDGRGGSGPDRLRLRGQP